MPHSEAQAWWADVQHVRESIERRRAGGARLGGAAGRRRRAPVTRRAAESLPPLDDLEWSPAASGQPTGRFDRTAPQRGEHAAPRARRTTTDRRGGESPAAPRALRRVGRHDGRGPVGRRRDADRARGRRRAEPAAAADGADHRPHRVRSAASAPRRSRAPASGAPHGRARRAAPGSHRALGRAARLLPDSRRRDELERRRALGARDARQRRRAARPPRAEHRALRSRAERRAGALRRCRPTRGVRSRRPACRAARSTRAPARPRSRPRPHRCVGSAPTRVLRLPGLTPQRRLTVRKEVVRCALPARMPTPSPPAHRRPDRDEDPHESLPHPR